MVACRHRFLKSLAFRVPVGGRRARCEGGGRPTAPPGTGPHQHLPGPTLPAGVPLRVLQGLRGGGEGDALEDVDIVAEEAELLVDAFHEAPFRVHRAQLGVEAGAQAGSGRSPEEGGGNLSRPQGAQRLRRDGFKEGPVCT